MAQQNIHINEKEREDMVTIIRRHIITITGAISQLILSNGLSIGRIIAILFAPLANLILDIIENSKKYNMNNDNLPSICPSNYESITIETELRYGEYTNILYEYISMYIIYIIKNNKNLNNGIELYVNTTDEHTLEPCITLKNENKLEFNFNIDGKDYMIVILANTIRFESNNYIRITYQYIISAENKNILTKFFDECKEYKQRMDKQSNEHYLYKYMDTGKESEWEKYHIALKKTFDNIFLSREYSSYLFNIVNDFYNHNNIQRTCEKNNKLDTQISKSKILLGGTNKISFLLYGEPGCGKSSIPYVIANEYNQNIRSLDAAFFKDLTFGRRLRNIKNEIILIEEIDTISLFWQRQTDDNAYDNAESSKTPKLIGPKKNDSEDDVSSKYDMFGEASKYDEKTMQKERLAKMQIMLDILDGYCYLEGCIIIMTTNHPEKIDKAFYRSGRIDHKLEFKHADDYQIKNIFAYYYDNWVVPECIVNHMIENNINMCYIMNTLIKPSNSNIERAFEMYKRDYPDFQMSWIDNTDCQSNASNDSSIYSII